ncbi:RAD52 motif-containing protein 1-like isoform X11 [Leopardus geoffroyi]|uniref:RAD52 motif-containing protein 1-like isoform X11 n=1 Tax=Leopardus geoffroyi TaxID=46844 RepID=UPI001E265560|nr:RAD52 motif-containing protein 1-like isoform X11 [Leopardus geoffroyi]
MAELVSFTVPTESDKTLLVWELSSGPTAEALHHSLFAVFSQFGLLYSVRVFPNAAVARPGFYAIIKFYSARDAHRAQKACDQKQLFQNSPVKLQDLSDLEERANEDTVPPLQKQSLKFFCALEVVLPSYECQSPGAGMAEEPLDNLEEGPLSFLMKRRTIQKLAIQKAVSDAFQKLLIVILESGKIAVEYRPCEEIPDASTEDELQDFIQLTKEVPGYGYNNKLILAISVTVVVMILIIVFCLIEIHSHRAAAKEGKEGSSRGFFGSLLRKRCSKESDNQEGFFWRRRPLWLRDMYRPLNATRKKNMAQKLHDKDSSDEDEIFNKELGETGKATAEKAQATDSTTEELGDESETLYEIVTE